MAQPIKNFEICIELLIKNNVKYYITFNELNYPYETIQEKKFFTCDDCKMTSIPIRDYTAPTKNQLLELWKILDDFHLEKEKNNKINLVMHCTAGTGRTPVMIISYLMYKMFYNSNEYKDDYRLIKHIIYNENITIIEKKKEIEKTKTYKYIYSEIKNKYSSIACDEVFHGEHIIDQLFIDRMNQLFIDRMKVIIDMFEM